MLTILKSCITVPSPLNLKPVPIETHHGRGKCDVNAIYVFNKKEMRKNGAVVKDDTAAIVNDRRVEF